LTLNVLNLLFNVQSIAFPLWRRDIFNMISETPLALVAGGVFCFLPLFCVLELVLLF
jgi:hypothetical protein